MMKWFSLLLMILLLHLSTTQAVEEISISNIASVNCKPVYDQSSSDFQIFIQCDDITLPPKLQQRLEKELNKQIKLSEKQRCNPKFERILPNSSMQLTCGFSHENVQKLIGILIENYQILKKTLDELQVTEVEAGKLRGQAKNAFSLGELERTQSILDRIITLESEVGQKALKHLRDKLKVFEKAQVAAAQANGANSDLMRLQFRYEAAARYFLRAVDSIELLSKQLPGVQRKSLAYYLHQAAYSYYEAGLYSEAKHLYQRSLVINEKDLGKDHLIVAKTGC